MANYFGLQGWISKGGAGMTLTNRPQRLMMNSHQRRHDEAFFGRSNFFALCEANAVQGNPVDEVNRPKVASRRPRI
jgi:hypothetical protein